MKRKLMANVWRDDDQYVARCVELPIVSQGDTEEEAIEMLKEALELYFSEPYPGSYPNIRTVEVEVDAA